MLKKCLITFTLLTSVASFAAQQAITFALEASYPPFEFVNKQNQIVGFDIDIANALCQKMSVSCQFSNQAFDSLIPGLRFHRFDAVISGMDITPARSEQVDFSQPYYNQNSAQFVVLKGNISTVAQLKGQNVGMQNGSTHQRYLQAKHPEIHGLPYDSYQTALLDLKNGRLAAVLGDTAVINDWLKKEPQLTPLDGPVTDKDYYGAGLGIAVRKNNSALLKQINQALSDIKQDGTYQQIYQKWFK